ncbi:hypothetical protein [Paraburkholderia sp. Ac-20347]|uniref:hypothetical protein n=1 Tax=Paraburkholderia sp. Ac-20347 TaxID=2703892 RepID=UPI00198224CF|nr:hypothetical protein [Paraburkholderia sp. Ac-20347]
MQVDLFADFDAPAAPQQLDERGAIAARHAAAIEAIPEKLRPTCAPLSSAPAGAVQLDEWTRTSQRAFLLWMIGAIARGLYTVSSMSALPGVLHKLNGLGGEW